MATATVTTKQHGAYNKLSRTKQGFSAVDYAMNPKPHNTDHGQVTDRVLATSYGNCTKNVKDQWNIVWSQAGTKKKDLNEVQRQIQSFSNDLNYHSKHDIQLANNIGYQTGWYLYGQHGFQFMVVTQADGRSHLLHNHILVNETNPITHKQLRGNPTSISYVRNISDRVLQYYGLSTMNQTPYLSPDHKVMAEVRLNDQKKYVWKQDLKNRLNQVASHSTSWDQFINNSYNQYGIKVDPYKKHKDKRTGKKVITKDLHGNPKFKKHISYYFKGQDHKYHTARDRRLGTNYGINHLDLTIKRNHALKIDQKQKQSLASNNVVSEAENITKSATLINHSQSSYSVSSSTQTVKNEPNPSKYSVSITQHDPSSLFTYSALNFERVNHVKSVLSSADQYEATHNLTGAQRSSSIASHDYEAPTPSTKNNDRGQSHYSARSSAQVTENEPNRNESFVSMNDNLAKLFNNPMTDSEQVDHVKAILSSDDQFERNHHLTGVQRSNSIANTNYLSPVMSKSPSESNTDVSTTMHSPTEQMDQDQANNQQKQQNNNYQNIINNKKNSAKRKDQKLLKKYANPYLARFSRKEQLSIIKSIYIESDRAIKRNEHQLKLDAVKRPAIVRKNDQIDRARRSRHEKINEIQRRAHQATEQSKQNDKELQDGSNQEDLSVQEAKKSDQETKKANHEDPSRLQEFIHKSLQACQSYYEKFERKVYSEIHKAIRATKIKERNWQKEFKHQQLIRKEHKRNSLNSEISKMIHNDIGGATQSNRQERSNNQRMYQSYASSMDAQSEAKARSNSASKSINESSSNLSEASTISTGSPLGFEDSMERMNRSIRDEEDPNYQTSISRSSASVASASTSESKSSVKSKSTNTFTPNIHQILNNQNKLTLKQRKILKLRRQKHGFKR